MSTARILRPAPDEIRLCAERLRAGAVVAMPTETVYGLAAVAFDEAGVARVFAAKERPTFDPLIVHVAPDEALLRDPVSSLGAMGVVATERASSTLRAQVAKLAEALWPGPLTLVLPRSAAIPDLVTAGLPTVAVRMPRHPVAQALIAQVGSPLAAPSANRFGRISPTRAEDVLAELGDRIELILDGGPCEVGLESTVLALPEGAPPMLLRPGGVSREAIEALVGPVEFARPDGGAATTGSASPGLLESHYAPAKRLRLLPDSVERCDAPLFDEGCPGPVGILLQSGRAEDIAARTGARLGMEVIARTLSESGDVNEAARHLFLRLRELDGSAAIQLYAEPCSDESGLGHAIADRLRRAAASR